MTTNLVVREGVRRFLTVHRRRRRVVLDELVGNRIEIGPDVRRLRPDVERGVALAQPPCSSCRPEISSVLSVSVKSRKPWWRSRRSAAGTSGCGGIEANRFVSPSASASLIAMSRVAASILSTAPPISVNDTYTPASVSASE
jgi:hypothetical protein